MPPPDWFELTRLLHQYQSVIDALLEERHRPIQGEVRLPPNGIDLDAYLRSVELELIWQAVQRAGSVLGASSLLGVNRSTLAWRMMSPEERRASRRGRQAATKRAGEAAEVVEGAEVAGVEAAGETEPC